MNQRPMPKVGEHLIRDGKIDRIVTADGKRTATFVASDESVDRYGVWALAYDERADRRSWRAMLNLFDEALGPL